MAEEIGTELNAEYSKEELEQLEEEVQNSRDLGDEQSPCNILVRGALLRCSCGSHPRRLNLPLSYGVYAVDEKHPKVHLENCEVGDPKNISYYGVCQSSTPPSSEQICLEPYVSPEGKRASTSNAEGKKCTPVIVEKKWFDGKDDDYIYDIDKDANLESITMNSFMVCKYGGVITPVTSGQEFSEE